MTFAGIDYDASSVDIVYLDADSNQARHQRVLLDSTGKANQVLRARRVRDYLPLRGFWRGVGVVAIGLEDPKGNTFKGSIPLARVQGAILACLPAPDVRPDVFMFAPWEWKKWCGLPGNGAKHFARSFAAQHWVDLPQRITQDALDAFAVAWATRAYYQEQPATAKGVVRG